MTAAPTETAAVAASPGTGPEPSAETAPGPGTELGTPHSDAATPSTDPGSPDWARPLPSKDKLRNDVVLAVVLAVMSVVTALLYMRTGLYKDPAPLWAWVVGLGLSTLPLAVRRRHPSAVAIAVAMGFFVVGQFGVPEMLVVNVTMFLALYTVGAWERNRKLAFWVRFGVSIAMLVWVLWWLILSSYDSDSFPGISRSGLFSAFATFAVIQIITNVAYFSGAFFFGNHGWRSAHTQAILEAQGRELELERRTSSAQAVALDRLAIARELHDVVAHHVSVMGLHAAAAQRTIERDPAAAASAIDIIESEAENTITELRKLVHTLRAPSTEGIASTLGIAQFPELTKTSQRAGVPTTLIVAGTPRPLPLLVDVALYRVAQEALTNVRKHAGRGAEATVRLRFMPEGVEVEISDTGVRATLARPSDLPGLGLLGMRERIGAVGGTLITGRREAGGFMVRATVPHPAPGASSNHTDTEIA